MVDEKRRRMAAQPLLHFLPNVLTIMGMCAGLTAMRYALDGRFQLAVALIVLAGILDGLDGRSARMLKITSKLGAQLDSLSDFLSFGVAPAFLVYLWTLNGVRGVGWALAMLFAACCALRLARFNIELDDPDEPAWKRNYFKGVPAPGGAGLAILPMILSFAFGHEIFRSWGLNAAMLLGIALLMVSAVPTVSFKRVRVKPQWALPTLLLLVMMIAFLVAEPWMALSVMGVVYIAFIPVTIVLSRRQQRRHDQAPAVTEEALPDVDDERIVNLGRRPPRN